VSARPFAEADLRASDADREEVVALLREAFAEGRLTPEEHSERVDAAYAARTRGELVPLTGDLPSHPHPRGASAQPQARPAAGPLPEGPEGGLRSLVAVFGGALRKGRWRTGRGLRAIAVFGGIEIDLSEAVFESQEVVIHCVCVFGGVSIRVPEGVTLQGGGAGIFGGFDVQEHIAEDPQAPVVRISGMAVFGGADAKVKRPKALAGR